MVGTFPKDLQLIFAKLLAVHACQRLIKRIQTVQVIASVHADPEEVGIFEKKRIVVLFIGFFYFFEQRTQKRKP
jgi:hypothetical protein